MAATLVRGPWKLSDDNNSSGEIPRIAHLLGSWVRDYLMEPHAELGRAGPVCPFARPALDRDMLWVAAVPGERLDTSVLIAELLTFRDAFLALAPVDGPDSLLKAVFIVFPDLADFTVIDAVQQAVKPDFVDAGLMVGQFYDGCTERGLWNDRFRPLQSPVPLIAIRQMVGSDFAFLNTSAVWIEAYLRRFAPTVPSPVRVALADRFGTISPT
ncbi:DUF6875 domain-containing protein [Mycolicibacterium sp. CBMA 226]|uniref:DUF6875 domain-containing protein n=1 Tax=Mycolicibacterium sp. CBMA 226 TaxID=2606611 RepID=UPI0012DCBD01|nr:hypothetical protein [Mycolicibacterium sp. CBMA 226]MUL79484.1 hypothetical protein [Mycolicibacterium sp. CBMA 226]